MIRHYHADGLSFSFPADWTLDRQEADNGWTLTLQSPGVAFAVLQLDRTLPDPPDMAQAALEAMQADYPTLDAESALETVAGEMALGHDMEFFSLDLLNSAWTRCFYGLAGTVFLLCQTSGGDTEDYEGPLRALCASLRLEED